RGSRRPQGRPDPGPRLDCDVRGAHAGPWSAERPRPHRHRPQTGRNNTMTSSPLDMKRIPVLVLALVALAVAGCGGSNKPKSAANPSNNGSASGHAPKSTPAGPAGGRSEEHTSELQTLRQ